MCAVSAKLIRYRAAFVKRLAEAATPIHREFSGGVDELRLEYTTVSTVDDPFKSEKEIFYRVCEHQEAHRRAEIDSGQCLTGAHKDDIAISINGRSAPCCCWTTCSASWTRSGRTTSSTASAPGRRSSPAARTMA